MKKPHILFPAMLILALACQFTFAVEPIPPTPANVPAEATFQSSVERKDPFNEIELDAVFTPPGGGEIKVPAFWAGGKMWKVRYASPVVGRHTFKTVCSDPADVGLNGVTGAVDVVPYTGDNALFRHGPVRVAADQNHFEHADGTPFLWLGDTWWMGLTARLHWPDEFATLTADRTKKGFNVVQIVAGLYPDMPAFDDRGANEAGQPWERDYARIRPEYFDAADRRIAHLAGQGIMPCIVGAWGYHLPWLGVERIKKHERYLYARWGAWPIAWCVAGETNLPYYLAPGFPNHGEKQTADWAEVIRYCRSINAFARPISAHPTGVGRLSMRDVLPKPETLLDFDMIQTPHGQMEVLKPTVDAARFSHAQRPPLLTVNAEPSYEMLFDRTPAAVARMVFWVSWAGGVKGYTYGANGIWQMNRRDKPYGNSPHGGTYGKIAWDDAMNLPGSTQVSLAKKLFETMPWEKFEPMPNGARWVDDSLAAAPGSWIWSPEGDAAIDAPIEPRYFRRAFDLPADAKVEAASLRVAADDRCTVWLNGVELGKNQDWHNFASLNGIAAQLHPGHNVLAIRAENMKSAVTKNPAGLVLGMSVQLADKKQIDVRTDAGWLVANDALDGWQKPEFDDHGWAKAKIVAPYGGGPWGRHSDAGGDAYDVPYVFGVPGVVRLVYCPKPAGVTLTDLEPDVKYRASWFDPETGDRKPIGDMTRDTAGAWHCDLPAGVTHDWVVILDARKADR